MKIKFIKDFMATQSDDYRDLHATLIKCGDIVDADKREYNGSCFDMPKEQAQWLIDNGFAEEVKESGWWNPKKGEEYYFVNVRGNIDRDVWCGDLLDIDRFAMGNCFKTVGAAKRYRDYLKAVAIVRQDEGVLTPEEVIHATDVGVIVGQIIMRNRARKLEASTCNLGVVFPSLGTVYFSTKAHAQASLDKHPDEWKTIANYDWSRE